MQRVILALLLAPLLATATAQQQPRVSAGQQYVVEHPEDVRREQGSLPSRHPRHNAMKQSVENPSFEVYAPALLSTGNPLSVFPSAMAFRSSLDQTFRSGILHRAAELIKTGEAQQAGMGLRLEARMRQADAWDPICAGYSVVAKTFAPESEMIRGMVHTGAQALLLDPTILSSEYFDAPLNTAPDAIEAETVSRTAKPDRNVEQPRQRVQAAQHNHDKNGKEDEEEEEDEEEDEEELGSTAGSRRLQGWRDTSTSRSSDVASADDSDAFVSDSSQRESNAAPDTAFALSQGGGLVAHAQRPPPPRVDIGGTVAPQTRYENLRPRINAFSSSVDCGAGAMQHVTLDQTEAGPVLISAWAAGWDKHTRSFSLSAVLTFSDGTASDDVRLFFSGESRNWQNRCVQVDPVKPVQSVSIFLVYTHSTGAALIDDVIVASPGRDADTAATCRSRCVFSASSDQRCLYVDLNYRSAVTSPAEHEVTLTTAFTYWQIPLLEDLAKLWEGRISATFYVHHSRRDLQALKKLYSRSQRVRDWVSVHLLYSPGPEHPLPLSAMHNIAYANAPTPTRLRFDVEYLPSKGLRVHLQQLVKRGVFTGSRARSVLVLPDFKVATETDGSSSERAKTVVTALQHSKEGLFQAVKAGSIHHSFFSPGVSVSFSDWVRQSDETPVTATAFDVAFAPFFMASSGIPPPDSRVLRPPSGKRLDLDAHVSLMRSAGFEVLLLSQGFAVASAHPAARPDAFWRQHIGLRHGSSQKQKRQEIQHIETWLRYKKDIQRSQPPGPVADLKTQTLSDILFSREGPNAEVLGDGQVAPKSKSDLVAELDQAGRRVAELEQKIRQQDVLLMTAKLAQQSSDTKHKECERVSHDYRLELRELDGVAHNAAKYHKAFTEELNSGETKKAQIRKHRAELAGEKQVSTVLALQVEQLRIAVEERDATLRFAGILVGLSAVLSAASAVRSYLLSREHRSKTEA